MPLLLTSLDGFVDWLKARGRAWNSIKCYRRWVRKLFAWLDKRSWEARRLAEKETVVLYLQELEEGRSYGEDLKKQVWTSARNWLRFARETGLLPPKPIEDPEARPLNPRPWLISFEAFLRQKGCRRANIRTHLERLAHVGDFLDARGLEPVRLAEDGIVQDYIQHWEAGSERLRPAARQALGSSIRVWIAVAKEIGLLPPDQPEPVPPVVRQFLEFMSDHRGLSISSLNEHRRHLVALEAYAGQQGVTDLVNLPLPLLEAFVGLDRRSRHMVTYVATSVRSFLRYLFLVGLESTDRSKWITSPRIYRSERLPKHLTDCQLGQLLKLFDKETRCDKKAWAVVTLLINYGLRIGEVASMRLEDADFRNGLLRVVRSKTRQESLYPLTATARAALLGYLAVRPKSAHPQLFLTSQAPHRPYKDGGTLCGPCVSKFLRRLQGLPSHGAHVIRHTLARRMREAGLPLPVMRQILGHKSSTSTGRYLRISVQELREVADNYAELL